MFMSEEEAHANLLDHIFYYRKLSAWTRNKQLFGGSEGKVVVINGEEE